MGTKFISFNSKVTNLETLCSRVFNNLVPVPSGIEITNSLKYFILTLNSILKDVTNMSLEMFSFFKSEERVSNFPSLNYSGFINALDKVLLIFTLINDNQYVLGKNILLSFEAIFLFLNFNQLQEIPYKISTLFAIFPYMLYKDILDLLTFRLFPLILCNENPNNNFSSIPAILSNVYLYVQEKALQSQLAETIMAYKKDFHEDILWVIAYGNENSHYASTRILFNYWPALNPVPSERKTKFMSWERPKCQVIECSGGKDNFGEKLCINPEFSIKYTERPPPCIICESCIKNYAQDKYGTSLAESQFIQLVYPLEYVALKCENKNCPNSLKNATHTCFSPECTNANSNRPLRLCDFCFGAKHNVGFIAGSDKKSHIFQEPVEILWSKNADKDNSEKDEKTVADLLGNLDFVVVEAIARLIVNVKPHHTKPKKKGGQNFGGKEHKNKVKYQGGKSDEFEDPTGYNALASVKIRGLNRSFSFDERLMLSRYGIYLLLGLTENYESAPYEDLGRLFSALFRWFDSTAYLPEGGLASSIEALKPDKLIPWIQDKTHFLSLPSTKDLIANTSFCPEIFFEKNAKKPEIKDENKRTSNEQDDICLDRSQRLFLTCLSPDALLPAFASGFYSHLSSSTGLFRLFCLVPYDVVTPAAWKILMPLWLKSLAKPDHSDDSDKDRLYKYSYTNDNPNENTSLLLKKTFDFEMSPLPFEPASLMYNFIVDRLCRNYEEYDEKNDGNIKCEDRARITRVKDVREIHDALTWLEILTSSEVAVSLDTLVTACFLPCLRFLRSISSNRAILSYIIGVTSPLSSNVETNPRDKINDDNAHFVFRKVDQNFTDWQTWKNEQRAHLKSKSNDSHSSNFNNIATAFQIDRACNPIMVCVAMLVRVLKRQFELQRLILPYVAENKRVLEITSILQSVFDLAYSSLTFKYSHDITVYQSESFFHHYWHLLNYTFQHCWDLLRFICPEFTLSYIRSESSEVGDSLLSTESEDALSSGDSGINMGRDYGSDLSSTGDKFRISKHFHIFQKGDKRISGKGKINRYVPNLDDTPKSRIKDKSFQHFKEVEPAKDNRIIAEKRLDLKTASEHKETLTTKISSFPELSKLNLATQAQATMTRVCSANKKGLLKKQIQRASGVGEGPLQIMTATVSMYYSDEDTLATDDGSLPEIVKLQQEKPYIVNQGNLEDKSHHILGQEEQVENVGNEEMLESLVLVPTQSVTIYERSHNDDENKENGANVASTSSESSQINDLQYVVPEMASASVVCMQEPTVLEGHVTEYIVGSHALVPIEGPSSSQTYEPSRVNISAVSGQEGTTRNIYDLSSKDSLGTLKGETGEKVGFEENLEEKTDLDETRSFWKTSQGEFKIIYAELPARFKLIHSVFKVVASLNRNVKQSREMAGERAVSTNTPNDAESQISNTSWKVPSRNLDILLKYRVIGLYKCLNFLNDAIISGQFLLDSKGENRGFVIWFQENLIIPTLWSLLAIFDSYLNQLIIPLFLKCLTFPNGRSSFWKLITVNYFNNDWKRRINTVNSLFSLFQLIHFAGDDIRGKEECQNCMSYAFYVLAYSIFDSNLHLAQYTKLTFHSLPFGSYKTIFKYLDWQFAYCRVDRLVILNLIQSLLLIFKTRCNLRPTSEFYVYIFYVNAFDFVIKHLEMLLIEQYLPTYSHTKMTPIYGFRPLRKDRKSQISRFNEVLVAYSTSFPVFSIHKTLQLTRKHGETDSDESRLSFLADKYFSIDSFATTKNDENLSPRPKKEQYENVFKEFSEEQLSSLIFTLSDSIISDVDLSLQLITLLELTLHILANLFPADTGKLEKKTNYILNEAVSYIQQLLLYRPNDRIFALTPKALRLYPLVNTFLSSIYQVLDTNVAVGYKMMPLVLDLLFFLPSPQIYATDNPPKYFTLALLDEPQKKLWLTALNVIFFKYEIDENPLYVRAESLAVIVIQTLFSQFFEFKRGEVDVSAKHPTFTYSAVDEIRGSSPTSLLRHTVDSQNVTQNLAPVSPVTKFASFLKPNSISRIRDDEYATHSKSHTGGLSSAFSFESLASILKKSPQHKGSADLLDITDTASSSLLDYEHTASVTGKETRGRKNANISNKFPDLAPSDRMNVNNSDTVDMIKDGGEYQEDTLALALVCLEIFVRRCQSMASQYLVDILMLTSKISTHSFYPGEENPCDFDLLNPSNYFAGGQSSFYGRVDAGASSLSPVHQGLTSFASSAHTDPNTYNTPHDRPLPHVLLSNLTSNSSPLINRDSFFIPGHCRSIAQQMLRCILHQYAPNRLFLRLFSTTLSSSSSSISSFLAQSHDYTFFSLFRVMTEVLKGFTDFTPLHPLSCLLQDFDREKALTTLSRGKLTTLLANLSDYLDCVSKREKFSAYWKSHLFSLFETFFSYLASEVALNPVQSKIDLFSADVSRTLMDVMLSLLRIPIVSQFKNLFDYFGKILTACLATAPIDIEQLWEMCFLCNSNICFSKDRDKQYFSRLVVSELVQVLTFKKIILPVNVLMIIQLILIDMGSSLGCNIMPAFIHQSVNETDFGVDDNIVDPQIMINSGASESVKHVTNEFVNFVSDIASITRLQQPLKSTNFLATSTTPSPQRPAASNPIPGTLTSEQRAKIISKSPIIYYLSSLSPDQNGYVTENSEDDSEEEKDVDTKKTCRITSAIISDDKNDDYQNISLSSTSDLSNRSNKENYFEHLMIQSENYHQQLGAYVKMGLAQVLACEMSRESEKFSTLTSNLLSIQGAVNKGTGGPSANVASQGPAWLRTHFAFLYAKKSLSAITTPPSSIPNYGNYITSSNQWPANLTLTKNDINPKTSYTGPGNVGGKSSNLSNEQQGLKDFTDCVSKIRLSCWILLASLHNNCLAKSSSNIPCQPFMLDHHPKISDLIMHLVMKFPEFSQSSVLHTTALFYGFILCQLWTIYNEYIISIHREESEVTLLAENALLSFWCQIIPGILQFLTISKSYPEMISLHLLNTIESLQEINASSLIKLFPLWRPILYYQEQLPSHLQIRLNKVLNWAPKLELNKDNFFHSSTFMEWLTKVQFKLSRTEMQSSMAIQIYTL
ncbi:protein unc-79 homolog isoform X1 [Gordionus sp. m RMFG-2023]|uniref:protein unc-79 homolog isoform X1 n=1 Tax=Gordionus sp. m RMFG-2023 TaxID=3053472 RepID=UPI0031FBD4B9